MKKFGFILEVLIGLALLEALGQFAGPRGFGENPFGLFGHTALPHPYWLVVILIAVRYGALAGFWGAAMCAGLYLAFHYSATDPGSLRVYTGKFLEHFTEPMLFLFVGAVVGETRSRQDHRMRHLRGTLADAEREAAVLKEDLQSVQQSKVELQKRIVGQVATVSTLYEAAKGLESLDPEELYPAILDLLTRYLGATSCSIYMLQDGRLVRKMHRATNGAPTPAAEYAVESSVMGQAIRRKTAVAVPELTTQVNFDRYKGDALMAAPILDLNQAPIGAISIGQMAFYDFNPSNRKLFDLIADWSNRALQNALYYQRAADGSIRDDELGFFNYSYFHQRIEEEFADAQRHEIPLSLMLLRFDVGKGVGRDRFIQFLKAVSGSLQASLRKVDIVTKYRTDRTLAVIVRTRKAKDVAALAERVEEELAGLAADIGAQPGDLEVRMGYASVKEKMKEPAELIQMAEKAAGLDDGGGED